MFSRGLDTSANTCWAFYFKYCGGNYYILAGYHDGSWKTGTSKLAALNTVYRVEAMWDQTNDLFSWWVDGAKVDTNIDISSSGYGQIRYLSRVGIDHRDAQGNGAVTVQFDKVAVSVEGQIGD